MVIRLINTKQSGKPYKHNPWENVQRFSQSADCSFWTNQVTWAEILRGFYSVHLYPPLIGWILDSVEEDFDVWSFLILISRRAQDTNSGSNLTTSYTSSLRVEFCATTCVAQCGLGPAAKGRLKWNKMNAPVSATYMHKLNSQRI